MASKQELMETLLEVFRDPMWSSVQSEEEEALVDGLCAFFYEPHPALDGLLVPLRQFVKDRAPSEGDGTVENPDEDNLDGIEGKDEDGSGDEDIDVIEDTEDVDDRDIAQSSGEGEDGVVGNGKYLEELAFVTFLGLKGIHLSKSYPSAMGQHDLLLAGDGVHWMSLAGSLYMDASRDEILVEAKSIEGTVEFPQFARLCCVIEGHLSHVGLGVFFTLNGVAKINRNIMTRQWKSASGARLAQLLFHAKHKVPIVVFDAEDIVRMSEPGALPKLLRQKIREITHTSGAWGEHSAGGIRDVDVPEHLMKYLREDTSRH